MKVISFHLFSFVCADSILKHIHIYSFIHFLPLTSEMGIVVFSPFIDKKQNLIELSNLPQIIQVMRKRDPRNLVTESVLFTHLAQSSWSPASAHRGCRFWHWRLCLKDWVCLRNCFYGARVAAGEAWTGMGLGREHACLWWSSACS